MAFTVALCLMSSDVKSSVILPGEQEAAAQQGGGAAATDAFGDTLLTAAQQSLAIEANDMGLTALAEGVRDDPEIRKILRDVLPTVSASQLMHEFEDRDDSVKHQVAAGQDAKPTRPASGERGDAELNPGMTDAAVELDEDGRLSLRQVLHAVTSPVKRNRATSGESLGHNDDDDGESGFDLTSPLLESRFLGDAMEQVIAIDSIDNSFSIFGAGHFELQMGGNQNFILTDLENNFSLALGPEAPFDQSARPPGPQSAKIDVLGLVLGFLESPTGVLMSIFAGTFLFSWSAVRMAAFLRR